MERARQPTAIAAVRQPHDSYFSGTWASQRAPSCHARLRGRSVDASRVKPVLQDLRLLYDVATPKEKGELLRLMFKQIVYRGPDKQVTATLYDRSGVEFGQKRNPLNGTDRSRYQIKGDLAPHPGRL
jgi:hypothetical protein